MQTRIVTIILVGFLLWSPALAVDQIKRHSDPKVLRGQVIEISPEAVKIDAKPIEQTVPVNDIDYIKYDEDPDALADARPEVRKGNFAAALNDLKKIELQNVQRLEIRQDVEYFIAYCTAKLALGGSGDVQEAGTLVNNFIKAHKGSYHYFEAVEILGDLAVAVGRFSSAVRYYDQAAKAPWPDAQLRINLAKARALMAQNKHADALPLLDSVLSSSVNAPQVDAYKLEAKLLKATCLAATKKVDDGVQLVRGVLKTVEPGDNKLHGQAWLAMGNCYRAAGQPKEALMAYLRIDVNYFQDPQIHAEALARLGQLWQAVNQPDRSKDALRRLKANYPNSRWNKA